MAKSRYKVYEGDTLPYFITATTVNWLPLFTNPDIAKIIIDSLAFLQSRQRISLYAYVVMKDHLHLVVAAENLSKELANFKSYPARQSIDYYKAQNNEAVLEQLALHKLPHRTDRKYQLWQEGVHPEQIHNQEMFEQKIRYIHYNPVRRGYVEEPEQWRYSSARNYAGLEYVLKISLD